MKAYADHVHDQQLLHRICSEYLEMPGLQLTRKQAERFFALSEHVCVSLLDTLVDRKFLVLRPDGRYALRSEDRVSAAPRFVRRRHGGRPLDVV